MHDLALLENPNPAVALWEIDQCSGLTRRADVTIDSRTTEWSNDGTPVQDPRSRSANNPEWVDGLSLRAKSLQMVAWNENGLVNPAAARLAPEINDSVEWTTLSPASGVTTLQSEQSSRHLTWSGQAASLADSRRAALVEGMERLVGSQQDGGSCIISSAAALPGRALSPTDFDAYPSDAYKGKIALFDRHEEHEWVRGESLVTGEEVWVPREAVYYGETPAYSRWFLGTSSGCATGSSVAEATLFGLLELIERDTFVNAWYGKIPAIPVAVDSVPGAAEMTARIRLLGWQIELGFLRNEWGVPVFVASVVTPQVRAFGAAAHLDLETAALRAITEAVAYAPDRESLVSNRRDRVRELLENPQLASDIDDHPLLPVFSSDPAYSILCGRVEEACALGNVAHLADNSSILHSGDARSQNHSGNLVHSSPPLDVQLIAKALVDTLGKTGIETFRVVQTAPFQTDLGLATTMTLAPALTQLDFGWHAQRVRTSARPLEQAKLLAGKATDCVRDLPHPFS